MTMFIEELMIKSVLFVSTLLLAICGLMNGVTVGFYLLLIVLVTGFLFNWIYTMIWEDLL